MRLDRLRLSHSAPCCAYSHHYPVARSALQLSAKLPFIVLPPRIFFPTSPRLYPASCRHRLTSFAQIHVSRDTFSPPRHLIRYHSPWYLPAPSFPTPSRGGPRCRDSHVSHGRYVWRRETQEADAPTYPIRRQRPSTILFHFQPAGRKLGKAHGQSAPSPPRPLLCVQRSHHTFLNITTHTCHPNIPTPQSERDLRRD